MSDYMETKEKAERLGFIHNLSVNWNEIIFYKNGRPECIYRVSTAEDLRQVIEIKESLGCYLDHIDLAGLIKRMGWQLSGTLPY